MNFNGALTFPLRMRSYHLVGLLVPFLTGMLAMAIADPERALCKSVESLCPAATHVAKAPNGCHITMAGRPSRASAIAAHPEQCTDNDNTAAVRCCDDSGGGFSPDCQTLDYEGAAAHCASTQGHRLCTKGELDQTKGSGCGFDDVRAWTSSTQEGSTSRFL